MCLSVTFLNKSIDFQIIFLLTNPKASNIINIIITFPNFCNQLSNLFQIFEVLIFAISDTR